MNSRRCYRCGDHKPASEFVKKASARDGLSGICKPCKRADDAEYRKNNKEKLKAAYHKMIEDRPTFWADYYARHRAKELIRVAEWSAENPDKKREMYREWYEANPGYHPKWCDANRDKVREKQRRAYAKKKSHLKYRLEAAIRTGVHRGITRGSKSARTFKLLGYSIDQLMRHLEKKFWPGMSWDNYGVDGWHIDHIIPLAVHNYETPDDIDFKRAWALKNLQPLWGPDNNSKSDKLEKEFQPSFALH